MEQSVRRECVAVRNSLGILDASTLGKIDVQGKDAKEFLNRVYTNNFDTLNPGKCRYGLMLKRDGMIFDDGVCACISKDHYLIHTTTGGAGKCSRLVRALETDRVARFRCFLNICH